MSHRDTEVVKLKSEISELKRLLRKYEWTRNPGDRFSFICLECKTETSQSTYGLKMAMTTYPDEFRHRANCTIGKVMGSLK